MNNEWYAVNSQSLIQNVNQLQQFLERRWATQQHPDQESQEDRDPIVQIPELFPPSRLETLYTTFNLSPFELNLLLMAVGVALLPRFSALCASFNHNPQMPYPTFGLGLQLFANAHWNAFTPQGPLRCWQLLEVGTGPVITQCPLQIDETILHYLMGEPYQDDRLAPLMSPLVADMAAMLPPSHAQIMENLLTLLKTETPGTVQLCGVEHSDKRAIAAAVGEALHIPVKILWGDRLPTDRDNLRYLTQRWQREAALTQSLLILDLDGFNFADGAKGAIATQLITDLQTPLIIFTEERIQSSRHPLISLDVPPLTYQEQFQLWERNLGEATQALNGELGVMVSQFNLSPQAIQTAAHHLQKQPQIELNPTASNPIIAQQLWQICRTMARPRLDDLAQRIDTKATWSDLVLPDNQLKILQQIAVQFRQRAKVYQEWGFAAQNNRGLGMTALFAGPSGTGKTMASEVLAQEFNLDLYRIDLSTVVSKYIGETEKNLRQIFDAAESGGVVLLFDEADALFGKRSEVKDSRDRHANLEVSYLLQRMESYQGLAVLTTNLKGSLDQAFLRRIRFMVAFAFPDAKARTEIWRRVFPPNLPTQDLNFEKLAQLAVTGGNIKNIVLNAAFIAAHAGEPVMMQHILAAARSEYLKMEKILVESEIEGWIE
ncbi:ATP-binding protein [Spirulina sp. CCNP1310]|uniref:ATP-binding protein n=1 Tax=Spirulina sp. CCNP1310 TaxID=3110249 RepID=UPI002B203B5F|nr:ATP-binding protein [Spirulina sp. CCNP1310]MEA5418401.1 ATP-binding protein [Spirulina sp. CCNP1310]